MLVSSCFLACLLAPPDVIAAELSLPSQLPVGQPARLEVRLEVADGWALDQAGLPAAILQVHAPDAITLSGEVLAGRALARNNFMHAPYERLAPDNAATIEFQLEREPAEGDRIALNVLAYAKRAEADGVWFIRQRYELPLAPGARGRRVSADTSDWGRGDTLQLGDRFPALELPRIDGQGPVDLGARLGKQNIVISTYRAFW